MDVYSDSSILEKKNLIVYSIVLVENNVYLDRFTRIVQGLDKYSISSKTEVNSIGFALDFCIQTKRYVCENYKIFNDNIKAINFVKEYPNPYIKKKLKLLGKKNIKVDFMWVPRKHNLAGKNIKTCSPKNIV